MGMEKIKNMGEFYKVEINKALEDIKTKGRRHRQIPNILSTSRLLAPFCIIPAAALGNIPLAAGFIVFFSLTDAVDGFVARKYKLTSELGKDLDVVSDKLFASTLLVIASFIHPILLINLGFEIMIGTINFRSKLSSGEPSSSMLGKIKTWFLYPLIATSFISMYADINTIVYSLFGASVVLQALTTTHYIADSNGKKKSSEPA